MDPNTGRFHPVEDGPLARFVKEVERSPRAMLPQGKSTHADLVFQTNQKPVPKDWPIFAVGDTYDIAGVSCEVAQIAAKDIHLRGDVERIERGAVCELQGREFRVRFTRGHFVVVRPVIGNVVST